MDFGDVIKELKVNPTKKFSRKGWNGKGMWISLQVPDDHSKMGLPYIYMKTTSDELVPWLASQTDMLADDWGAVLSLSEIRELVKTKKDEGEEGKTIDEHTRLLYTQAQANALAKYIDDITAGYPKMKYEAMKTVEKYFNEECEKTGLETSMGEVGE